VKKARCSIRRWRNRQVGRSGRGSIIIVVQSRQMFEQFIRISPIFEHDINAAEMVFDQIEAAIDTASATGI